MPTPFETALTVSPSGSGEAYCATCGRSFSLDHATCPDDGAKLVRFGSKADPLIGRVLDGRYRIEAPLGVGGMGAVYRGRQLSVDREVAIKVVHPALSSDREVAKRFLREARLASSLNAPGVVSVFDFGQTDDGVLFLVMELLEGKTLADVVTSSGRLAPGLVVQIASQLCDALDAAHSAGIVHRDLKPGNIIIVPTPSGEVLKVLDFGIAKAAGSASITSTRGMVGTPTYMAPEQFDGKAEPRSDLYSLGCILYELVSGAPPFTDQELSALCAKHLTEPPPPLPADVPRNLAQIIHQLLAKQPAERFGSAGELRTALGHVSAARFGSAPIIRTSMTPIAVPLDSSMQTTPGTRRRSPLPAIVLVALVLCGLGVGGYVLLASKPPTTAHAAQQPADAATVAVPVAPAAVAIDAGVIDAEAVVIDTPVDAAVPAQVTLPPAAHKKPRTTKPTKPTKSTKPTDDDLPFAPTH